MGWGAPEIGKRQEIESLMASMHQRADEPQLRTLGSMRSTWVFYGRTVVRPASGNKGQDAIEFVQAGSDRFLIATGGEYKVEIYYACPEDDVGSTIELSFGKSRLRGKVTPAHDPPLRGDENDRIPRQESYVKDFKPLKLGKMQLEQGTGRCARHRRGGAAGALPQAEFAGARSAAGGGLRRR